LYKCLVIHLKYVCEVKYLSYYLFIYCLCHGSFHCQVLVAQATIVVTIILPYP